MGYGLAHVLPADETWIPDSWETGSRIGEIESLSVLAEFRASGLALPGNTDATRLYEWRGYQPTWLYLSRFEG